MNSGRRIQTRSHQENLHVSMLFLLLVHRAKDSATVGILFIYLFLKNYFFERQNDRERHGELE